MTDLTHRRDGVHPVDAMLPAPRLFTLGLQGRISSEVVASKGVGEDWLELSRKHLGIQDWDRIPKCLRFSSSQSSLAGSVLVRFFVGYCQLLL